MLSTRVVYNIVVNAREGAQEIGDLGEQGEAAAAGLKEAADALKEAAEAMKDTGEETEKAKKKTDELTVSWKGLAAAGTVVVGTLTAVVGGMFKAGQASADLVNHYNDLSARSSVAAEDIQGLTAAFLASGQTAGQAEAILSRWPQTLLQAQQGTAGLVAVLDGMGVSVDGLRDGSVGITDIADALQRIEDDGERAAAAVALFGRQGGRLLQALANNASLQDFVAFTSRWGTDVGPRASAEAAQFQQALALLQVALDGALGRMVATNGGVSTFTELINAAASGVVYFGTLGGEAISMLFERIQALIGIKDSLAQFFTGLLQGAEALLTGKSVSESRALLEEAKRTLAGADVGAALGNAANKLFNPLEGLGQIQDAFVLAGAQAQAFTDDMVALQDDLSGAEQAGVALTGTLDGLGRSADTTAEKTDAAAEALARMKAEALGVADAVASSWPDMVANIEAALSQFEQDIPFLNGLHLGDALQGGGGALLTGNLPARFTGEGLASLEAGLGGMLDGLSEGLAARFAGGGLGAGAASGILSGLLGPVSGLLGGPVGVLLTQGTKLLRQIGAAGGGLEAQLSAARSAGDEDRAAEIEAAIRQYGSSSSAAIAERLGEKFDNLARGIRDLPSVLLEGLPQALTGGLRQLNREIRLLPLQIAQSVLRSVFSGRLFRGMFDALLAFWNRIKQEIAEFVQIGGNLADRVGTAGSAVGDFFAGLTDGDGRPLQNSGASSARSAARVGSIPLRRLTGVLPLIGAGAGSASDRLDQVAGGRLSRRFFQGAANREAALRGAGAGGAGGSVHIHTVTTDPNTITDIDRRLRRQGQTAGFGLVLTPGG